MSSTARSTWNNVLGKAAGIVFAVFLLVLYLPTAWAGFSTHGTIGAQFGSHDTIVSVAPGSPAAAAGLRPGDRMQRRPGNWIDGFALENGNLPTGKRLAIPFETPGGGTRIVQLVSVPGSRAPLLDAVLQAGAFLATATALIVAAAVVALRPGAMSWWLLLYAGGTIGATELIYSYAFLPDGVRSVFSVAVLALVGGTASYPILPFVLRFPYDRPDGKRLALYRASVALTIVAAAGFALYYTLVETGYSLGWYRPDDNPSVTTTILGNLPIPLAIVALLSTYFHTGPRERERLKWGIFGMSFAFAAYAASSIAYLYNEPLSNALQLFTVVLPLSLAYAIVRHRLIDFAFAANRAIVYSATTALIVGLVKGIDALSSWMLNQFHLALLFQALASVALGFVISRLHRTLGTVVDQTLFRRRLEAERRLRRVASAMAFANTAAAIDGMLTADPVDALALPSAAVFRFEPALGSYVRTASVGWSVEHARVIEADDRLALLLRTEQDVVRLEDVRWQGIDVPHGASAPVIAVPIRFRRDVSGFALYATHANGTVIDPDEQRLLVALADSAGTAYGLAEAERARARLAELEAQLFARTAPATG